MAPSFYPTQSSGRTQTEAVFPLNHPLDITQAHNHLATHPPAYAKEAYQHQPDMVASGGQLQQGENTTIQGSFGERAASTETQRKGLLKRIKSRAGKIKDSAMEVAIYTIVYTKGVCCLPRSLYRFIFSSDEDSLPRWVGNDWDDYDSAYREAGRFASDRR